MLNSEFDRNELVQLGVHRGSKSWKWNPSMKPFIYKKKWKTYFLDLEKIISHCRGVPDYINSLIKQKKIILFVTTRNSASEIVKEEAIRCGMPYLVSKWKRGFLTNFERIKRKIFELQRINKFIRGENFQNLTSKKKAEWQKKQNKLSQVYEGVINLTDIPNALFIIGIQKEKAILLEAKNESIDIPVIALCNTDCNPKWIDYVLPGNDQEAKSIKFFVNLVSEAIIKAKSDKISEENIDKEKEEK
ncbi:MAG: 30S ribosomal protein S2 [Mycoplasmataceae bacterium RC_NB112A]|nr:MAG: 30S ribosomal protein S2 [Mycoplasmataceae bacterium RC_NB112A]